MDASTEGRSWAATIAAGPAATAKSTSEGAPAAPGKREALLAWSAAAAGEDAADASARGTAGELVLALYGRIPVDSLELAGDQRLFDLLVAWDPDE